jgi:hypothetical protein
MIFRNKDAGKSSIFGESLDNKDSKPVEADSSMLESMRRKAWSEAPSGGDSLRSSISPASAASDDAASSGRAFVGMNSSRSIFDSITNNEKTTDRKIASEVMKIEENARRSALESERRAVMNPSGDIIRKDMSMHAQDHGRINTASRHVSIFDSKPFERMSDYKPELKKDVQDDDEKLAGHRQVTSKDVFEKTFSSLKDATPRETVHQSSVDKLWNSLKGKS